MIFRSQLYGFDNLAARFQVVSGGSGTGGNDAQGVMDQEMIYAAFRVQRAAKKLIQDRQGIGSWQTRYNPKRVVVASAPGQPPNTDTGILVNSIYVNTKAGENGGQAAIVGTDLLYGKYLELGTRAILPRPWLLPAFESTRDENSKAFRRALKRVKAMITGGGSGA